MLKNISIVILFLALFKPLTAQELPIGYWRDHLPFNKVIDMIMHDDMIYCATPYSLFSYNKIDGHLKRITKNNGLTDAGITKIAYSEEHKLMIVIYSNSNIDIIKDDRVINVPDILLDQLTGDKSIYNIHINDDLAFLSCGYGISVMDLVKYKIKETYFIGYNGGQIKVNDIAVANDTIYAATQKGLYKAYKKAFNLLSYEYWNLDSTSFLINKNITHVESFNGKLIINLVSSSSINTLYVFNNNTWEERSIYNSGNLRSMTALNDNLVITKWHYTARFKDILGTGYYKWYDEIDPNIAYVEQDSVFWIGDNVKGIVHYNNDSAYENYYPNGPFSNNVYRMYYISGKIWVASGMVNSTFIKLYNKDGVFVYDGMDWSRIDLYLTDTADDILVMTPTSIDATKIFVGAYGKGIFEFENDAIINKYGKPDFPFDKVSGLAMDSEGTLWVSNFIHKLIAMDADKNCTIYDLASLTNSSFMESSDILIDDFDQKWIVMPRDNNIIVFKDGKAKKLSNSVGNGNIPGTNVYCLAKDKDGKIWLGTNEGLAVFYTPENVFEEGMSYDAERIIIEQDGYAQYLMETEAIKAITVDGANRKWVGTANSGVYLFSADGQQLIHHFTKDNSPLYSDAIQSIVINHSNGEVFFGTDLGIISYKSDAIEGGSKHESTVYAYPNPVFPGYDGVVAVKGLVNNAHVTITDVAGNLIYKTTALGGQAIWNGKNMNGERPNSGVYLVFSTNDDGSETMVTKILLQD